MAGKSASLPAPESEREVLRRAIDLITEKMPSSWKVEEEKPPGDSGLDGLLVLESQGGKKAFLAFEAKRVIEPRDVTRIFVQIQVARERFPGSVGVVAARFLSASTRDRLTEAGISYIDATGNARIEIQEPAVFISAEGAASDPWRGPGRPRGTLKGEPPARIVRTLADFSGDWAMRELADMAGTSTGATYRVVEFLEREGLASRATTGRVQVLDWTSMLRRWSDDYTFATSNRVVPFLAPRGLDSLLDSLSTSSPDLRHAVTGTWAAEEWAAYAPARNAMIYVENADEAAKTWELRPTDRGANVLLAESESPVPFTRTVYSQARGIILAAPTQVVVDLMTGPGRAPSEAEELLAWMKRDESSWRR